jgi:hypothetical protein
MGAKGAGEAGIIPMPAAIVAAIEDALGVEINSTPQSPDTLFGLVAAADREAQAAVLSRGAAPDPAGCPRPGPRRSASSRVPRPNLPTAAHGRRCRLGGARRRATARPAARPGAQTARPRPPGRRRRPPGHQSPQRRSRSRRPSAAAARHKGSRRPSPPARPPRSPPSARRRSRSPCPGTRRPRRGLPGSACSTRATCSPATTNTREIAEAAPTARAAWTTSGSSSSIASCFGPPNRLARPAAKTTAWNL